MKYYLHDSSAFQDEKITELYINFGYEGLGLFYTILEKIALQEKPVKTIVLKRQLNVGKKLEKCWSFMESIGLISSNNGETFNEQLLKFSEKYQIKKEKNKERISQWRENQSNIENVTRYESVSNIPKDNISKVKESKYENEFVIFWDSYDKKVDRVKCERKFNSLPKKDIESILEIVGKYVLSTPDPKYRKNPLTWLNGKCWQDEIKQVIPIQAEIRIPSATEILKQRGQ